MYGHSLGSVIAYDILCYAWIERARQNQSALQTTGPRWDGVEDLLKPMRKDGTLREWQGGASGPDIRDVRERQHEAWHEYRRTGSNWLVTDFVTAGSPLAHGAWLLNYDKRTNFDALVAEHIFPTCPPQTEPSWLRRKLTFARVYRDPRTGLARQVRVPHYDALFAITRWCNLYFPASGANQGRPCRRPAT